MRHLLPTVALVALSASQAMAQAADEDGVDLMERGAQMLLRGLLSEMAPALDELDGFARRIEPALQGFVAEMGPALGRVLAAIDDIRNYDGPVILRNGDILIRRRDDAPPLAAPIPSPDGEDPNRPDPDLPDPDRPDPETPTPGEIDI